MRRNRKDNTKKERIIMIASSAFVLAALTMTGVYMQSNEQKAQDDGYTIDFTALENNVEEKGQEISDNSQGPNDQNSNDTSIMDNPGTENMADNLDDDLDYLPMEAGSNLVELPGLTEGDEGEEKEQDADVPAPQAETIIPELEDIPEEPQQPDAAPAEAAEEQQQEALGDEVVVNRELRFSESDGLLRPLAGETLIPFSTDKSVYFSTLDQYKRSTAMVIAAAEGTAVAACAEGRVVDIFSNEEIGHAVTVELGDGYRITYGQLRDIQVSMDSYVNAGDTIAAVAAPTKYYSLEGSNLYLQLTANGTPVDPEPLLR